MTAAQRLRAERRRMRELAEREHRAEVICGTIAILLALALYCVVGTMDYQDRVRSLSGPMGPSPEWWCAE